MLSRWLCLGMVGGLCLWTGCSRSSAPSAPEVPGSQGEETVTPPPPPSKSPSFTPAFKITPIEPPILKKYLHVYYQHEGIPVPWVEEWLQGKDVTVVQRALSKGDPAEWPTDGDIYLVEPRVLPILLPRMTFVPWPESSELDALNPIFLGYGFDPDNLFSRPWRWTPYVFVQKKPKEGASAVVLEGADWFARTDIAWPADEELLQGLWKKRRGFSANLGWTDSDRQAWDNVWASLRTSVRDEESCWKSLIHDDVKVALLPAARRLQAMGKVPVEGDGDGLLWLAPSCGTLLRIEYLMVRSGSERQAEALELAEMLLSPAKQVQVTEATGYFPARSYLGHALDALPLPLSGDGWMDRSEFLNGSIPEPSVAPEPEPAPSSEVPAASPQSESQDVPAAVGSPES